MRLLLLVVAGLCNVALAQSETSPSVLSTTPLRSPAAEPALGSQLRLPVEQAIAHSLKGDHARARPALLDAAKQCDAYLAVPGRQVRAFRSQRQYLHYLDTHGDGQPTDWLDMACANAYKQLGYIAVEQDQIEQALRWLDKAHASAPYEPEPLTERGAALTRRRDWAGSLENYRQALALTRSHPEAAYLEALALRGTGFALIELGDLPAARQAYEASLQLDPESRIAANELTYIQQLQRKADADSTATSHP
jgi:Flp pilus assembly protein TadD